MSHGSHGDALSLAIAGGGTGGHVVPGLHLVRHFLEVDGTPLRELVWFLSGRAVEERVLEGVEQLLGDVPLERVVLRIEPPEGGAPSLSRTALRALPETRAARAALKRHGSQVLLGLGGYTTVPPVLAAVSLRVPVALLEINGVAGRATTLLGRVARRVLHAWPSTLPPGGGAPKHVLVGPPLAPGYTVGPPSDEEALALRAELGFDPRRPLLVVLGGSQGALGLNRFLVRWAREIVGAGVQVAHQVGPGRLSEGCAPFSGYAPVEYLRDVDRVLGAATVVLCRGGASTLAEVGARARPAVVVPYPHHADRHQEKNAYALGDGVIVVPESRLGSDTCRELIELCGPRGAVRRAAMARALVAAVPTDGSARLREELVGLAKE